MLADKVVGVKKSEVAAERPNKLPRKRLAQLRVRVGGGI